MKGNKKILVIAVLLLLIAVSYTTYAIYKTSVDTNSTVTAAAWTVKFKNGSNEITDSTTIEFAAADCTGNLHVANGVIAPGATCRKTITLDVTGTQVDVAYTATTGTVTATKNNESVSTSGANTFSASLSPASGTIAFGNTTQDLELVVTWAKTEGETVDPKDTALEGATISVPVTLVAKQVVE